MSLKGKENDTYEGKKPVPLMDRKVSPNYLNNSYLIYSQTNQEREARSAYGEYHNVFLSETEYGELKQEIRELDRLIEELSSYMRSSGKQYADHAVTLRRYAYPVSIPEADLVFCGMRRSTRRKPWNAAVKTLF